MSVIQHGRRWAALAVIAWIVALLALLVGHLVLPQRSGPLALTMIVEPYLVLSALVVAPVLLVCRRMTRTALVAMLLAATVVRYGQAFLSLSAAAPADATLIDVVSWNLQAEGVAPPDVAALVASADVDIVGLQELRPATADALSADAGVRERFPYQAFAPQATVLGMGLLSSHPITEQESWSDPPLIRAVIEPSGGAAIGVVVAHPFPPRITTLAGVPFSLDTSRRDAAIGRIRERVDADLASRRSVIILGDFNVTEREPAYADLASGLHDAHLGAGHGPGLTWRPPGLQWLPFGLLRIDYVLAGPDLVPLSAGHDCRPRGSDHCIVSATFGRSDE